MHHGSKKLACKNTPPVKWATRKTSDNASIPPFLPKSGVSVISPGGPSMASRRRRIYRHRINDGFVGMGQRSERRCDMNAIQKISTTDRYARCVQASKRVRWDIDADVIRGRLFN